MTICGPASYSGILGGNRLTAQISERLLGVVLTALIFVKVIDAYKKVCRSPFGLQYHEGSRDTR